MKQYLDPDTQPPLPLVEIPDRLNPFREDGVRIYAKMMTALPCQNVKALPGMSEWIIPGIIPQVPDFSLSLFVAREKF